MSLPAKLTSRKSPLDFWRRRRLGNYSYYYYTLWTQEEWLAGWLACWLTSHSTHSGSSSSSRVVVVAPDSRVSEWVSEWVAAAAAADVFVVVVVPENLLMTLIFWIIINNCCCCCKGLMSQRRWQIMVWIIHACMMTSSPPLPSPPQVFQWRKLPSFVY